MSEARYDKIIKCRECDYFYRDNKDRCSCNLDDPPNFTEIEDIDSISSWCRLPTKDQLMKEWKEKADG